MIGSILNHKYFIALTALIPVFFLIAMALDSTAKACSLWEGEKCNGQQVAQMALSSNAFFLIAAITAVLGVLFTMFKLKGGKGKSKKGK